MARKPASNQRQDAGGDKRPAGSSEKVLDGDLNPIERPRRLNRPRQRYKDRLLQPDRMNGSYDIKD